MTKEEYGKLAVAELREQAKTRGIKGVSSMRKQELIDALLQSDAQAASEKHAERSENRPDEKAAERKQLSRPEDRKESGTQERKTKGTPEDGQARGKTLRRPMPPRPDGHARVIVRRSTQGQTQPSQPARGAAPDAPGRSARPAAPMT